LNIETEIVAYLAAYGNTKETDIISFGMQKLHRDPKEIKKIVNRMAVKGRIHRIVHNKLKPPEVYISLYEFLPAIFHSELLEEDVRKILGEAEVIAGRRVNENFGWSDGSK